MCYHSKVIREACEKDPKQSEFEVNDVFGFAKVFQSVVEYVHDDIVPIGPGGVVGWFSKEARLYVDHMMRLYRFALKYQMEDLADRAMDELQAHEHRCGGYLTIAQIYEAYLTSPEDSKLRQYCATSFYQWATTRTIGPEHWPLCRGFMVLREDFPEVENDFHRAAMMHERKGLKQEVDYRDRSTFGTCEFHTHKKRALCSAADPEFAELRSWGDGPMNVKVPLKDRYVLDNEDEMEDSGTDVEAPEASPELENTGKTPAETTAKYTRPRFEDSGLSVAGEAEDVMQRVRGSTTASKPHPSAHIGDEEGQKRKKSPLVPSGPSFKHEDSTKATLSTISAMPQIQAGIGVSRWVKLKGEDEDDRKPLADRHISPDQKHKTGSQLKSKKSKKSKKVIQSALKHVSYEIVKCRACDQVFPRKQELLEHLVRKKGDRNHRMSGRSFNLEPSGNLVPIARKNVRFDL